MAVSLVDLLERAARTFPERPAVGVPGGTCLTWAELERASRALAESLQGCGVRKGDRVGLAIQKSAASVVSVWGILRAGAAYVPTDPTAPVARSSYVAANCNLAALVYTEETADLASHASPHVPGMATLLCEPSGALREITGAGPIERRAAGPTFPSTNVRDLAYILYTSGSTGTPKGVMLSHGAALSFVDWAVNTLGLRSTDILSNHAPLHFDLSTFDLFAAAAVGAKVVVLDEEVVRFPMASADVMERESISVWYSVPGALRRMARMGKLSERALSQLRMVLFAGEPYPIDELRNLQKALPKVELYNLYGPTETNVCTWWRVPERLADVLTQIPIGFDCSSCEGVVVDEELQPVPDGELGELLVRGGTLMDGYWGDPERTARAFTPDLLYPHLPGRMYRTGDLVRRRSDGAYDFHGRRDHMVKIRGYRVELGEIESALLRVPGIREAAVVAKPEDGANTESDCRLAAFIVPENRSTDEDPRAVLGADVVCAQLGLTIPKYMIPAEIHFLDSLPTTSNGKVDRLSLTSNPKQRPSASAA
jgi:amino acid adenylation domain-containing protein